MFSSIWRLEWGPRGASFDLVAVLGGRHIVAWLGAHAGGGAGWRNALVDRGASR